MFAIPGIGNAEGWSGGVQNLGCDRFSDGLARWAPQSKHNQELGSGDSLILGLAGGASVYSVLSRCMANSEQSCLNK